MQLYKYETHTHSSESSKCSIASANELVDYYKSLGYTGIIITDHFFNGNTTVPKNLPWKQRIDLFCKGYENAYEAGQKSGLDVFFGWEYSYKGSHFLTYGLDKNWLKQHPEIMDMNLNDYCDFARNEGGFISHAHPYREDHFIDMIRLVPRKVDAVEVINASRPDFENKLAKQYAANYGLLETAGSDTHSINLAKTACLALKNPIKNIHELIAAIKTGKAIVSTD